MSSRNRMQRERYDDLPEESDPIIEVWGQDFGPFQTYWQIGTSSVSRVKIDALMPFVEIYTEEATTIVGTASENFEPIQTLGTAYVHLYDAPCIKVHVTRSRDVAPFVADGIIGHDLMKMNQGCWKLNKRARTFRVCCIEDPVSALPGSSFIPDYVSTLRKRLQDASISRGRNDGWAVTSDRVEELRAHLPVELAHDGRFSVTDVLKDYVDCFYLPGDNLGATRLLKYSIKTAVNKPINIPQNFGFTEEDWDEIEAIISDLLEQGIIRESTSPFNFPFDLQPKKCNSRGIINYRIAVDYFALNKRLKSDAFYIPTIKNIVDELNGDKYFSVLDLASASYQIEIFPEDRWKTAFTTRSGHYEFLRMPVGIKNASQYIQRMMNKVLEDMRGKAFVCHDDILIHAPTIEEHEVRLRHVLSYIRDAGLKLQPDKCQLFCNSVKYLGHVISDEGWFPDPIKIDDLLYRELPHDRKDLQSYLGSYGAISRFIPDYAARSKPLWHLAINKPEGRFEYDQEAMNSFHDLRSSLCENLLLRYPDWNREFFVDTSSSVYGIEATLMQGTSRNGNIDVIAHASRNYKPSEIKYTPARQHRLASDWGKAKFRRYLRHAK